MGGVRARATWVALAVVWVAGCGGEINGDRPLGAPRASSDAGAGTWMNYHWPRRAMPIAIRVGDDVTADVWRDTLSRVLPGWNASAVVRTQKVSGASGDTRTCAPSSGRVEVCNDQYGLNGWLGLATIWVTGDEIQEATVRLNDSYFGTADYDDRYARQHVLCQELGHTFGLDHQRTEVSCMNDIEGLKDPRYIGPGANDFALLQGIYAPDSPAVASQQALVAGEATPAPTRVLTFAIPLLVK